jgi:hypothetical protein
MWGWTRFEDIPLSDRGDKGVSSGIDRVFVRSEPGTGRVANGPKESVGIRQFFFIEIGPLTKGDRRLVLVLRLMIMANILEDI